MWKLWPKAWTVGRNVTDHRKFLAAEALHARWRGRLATALTRVLSREISEDEAPLCLDELTGEHLLALDLALRLRQWDGASLDPSSAAHTAPDLWQDGDAAARFLLVATCDWNGFIRQEALRQFGVYAGRLALSAALIRSTDWVPQVQAAAESLLDLLLEKLPATALLDQLDLLVALRRRQRLRSSLWEDRILPRLSTPEATSRRWRWISEGPWRVRMFALQLVMLADPARREEALRYAVATKELPIALWAVSVLPKLAPQPRAELVELATRHPAAAVRAAALRETHSLDPVIALPILAKAIFDLARAPRTVAVRELDLRFGEYARARWRAALTEPDSRRWRGAFFGLCDAPEPEDIPRIFAGAEHQSAAVRSATLRGLLRARAPMLGQQLNHALIDKSKAVVGQALEIYRGNDFALERENLESAIRLSNNATRSALISAARQLGKWDALDVLLNLAFGDSTRDGATKEIAQWVTRANLRFTSPTPALLLRIREGVEALGSALPSSLSVSLLNILKHA
jgi:hypothetical protein